MSRAPDHDAPAQLELPVHTSPADVRIYRVAAWPPDADPPSVGLAAGRAVTDLAHRDGVRVARLTVTANRRSWISVRRTPDGLDASVHWRLLRHPRLIADTLGTVARTGKLSAALRAHIASLPPVPHGDYAPPARPPARARGAHVDLAAALQRVAPLLDTPEVADKLTIGWGRGTARRRRRARSLRLGRLSVGQAHISLHPVLDNPGVPQYVIDMVVYHELCHFVAPPLSEADAEAQREHRVHHRAFRRLESRYPRLQDAETWIASRLTWLLDAATSSGPTR